MDRLDFPEFTRASFLMNVAKLGALEANKLNGSIKAFITKQEACRRYTRVKVEQWIREGKLKKSKDDTWKIDPVYIQALLIEEMPIYKAIKNIK